MPANRTDGTRIKAKIIKSMLGLLKNKDFSEITITEITQNAGVSRASYYRNFKSKYDVIEDAVASICRELSIAQSGAAHSNLSERLEYSLNYVLKRKETLLALYRNGFGNLILESMNAYIENAAGDMPNTSVEKYRLYFAVGAVYNCLMKWLDSGAKESPQALAKACAKFMGLNPVAELM